MQQVYFLYILILLETEKYAHVTFFFNGGTEAKFPLEDRGNCFIMLFNNYFNALELIQSPKVKTYDEKPEMSAIEVAEKVAIQIKNGKYPFVMCNFAPPYNLIKSSDMVGHTGIYSAAITAVEATDKAIGIIKKACDENGYVLFVTSDHGNAEQMLSEEGTAYTAHTCNKVPFLMTGDLKFKTNINNPSLCDVAPTILSVMGLTIPKEMTGRSLV